MSLSNANSVSAGFLEEEASLYDPESATLVHHVGQALRAHKLFQRDKDYIVRNNEVVLIDEFTGRMMAGRRLSDGLHQAIEAKENVAIQPENVTLASVTFQNYFRLFEKLAGMTGTAMTEAEEFAEIYGLGVVEIPTNLPIARADDDDRVYRTSRARNTMPWSKRSKLPTRRTSRSLLARPLSRSQSFSRRCSRRPMSPTTS